MRTNKKLLDNIRSSSQKLTVPIAGLPLVEILGTGRALIENHLGVTQYGDEEIRVRVKFGHICVSGSNLKLCNMTKNCIVICGTIQGVSIYRGN